MTQMSFYLKRLAERMWFLPAVFSVVAVLTIVIAFYLARWAPDELPFTISHDAIKSILTILATSLLAVAVFALSSLVSALSSASASTSPRAVALIVGDRGAQTSISVFIGAFLFSILAIVGLSAGIYSSAGRLFLFAVTLCVLVLVVVALIRWIAQISDIGRVGHTIDRVEAATAKAFANLQEHPLFDCRPLEGAARGRPVCSTKLGYVQHFDAEVLQRLASEHDLEIVVTARPGAYVSTSRPLMMVEGELGEELEEQIVDAFVVGDQRTFDNDPRYGLVVLAEIADRALSPGVNDPGTAIDVVGTLTRVLCNWQPDQRQEPARNDRVAVPPLDARDIMEDAFRPIARDGAGIIEVVLRLLNGLDIVARSSPFLREAAIEAALDAISRARMTLTMTSDLRALESAATAMVRLESEPSLGVGMK